MFWFDIVVHNDVNVVTALGRGSAASTTPLSAPTLVPKIRCGTMPASSSACSMPTWVAPSTPPPPNTNVGPSADASLLDVGATSSLMPTDAA